MDSKSKYSEDDIIKMLELLVENIFVVFVATSNTSFVIYVARPFSISQTLYS